jgi:hypothetical protein
MDELPKNIFAESAQANPKPLATRIPTLEHFP